MKKFLGFVIITSFVCSYAMNSKEVRTLSIVNESEANFTLIVALKGQKQYKRRLAPQSYKDFFVIKNLDEVVSFAFGTESQARLIGLDVKKMTRYKHSLIALKFVETPFSISNGVHRYNDMVPTMSYSKISSLEKPMSVEYPEFNCLCGYITSRMMDTMCYFPGAYNYARINYSIPGLDTQMNMDLIPANALFNVPDICAREDVERAYAELCEIWNPERFDNPHQRTFAKRMMDILNEKYASLKASISEYDCFLNSVQEF